MSIPTKAVKAEIFNEKGELLLLQRNKELRGEENFDLPGGLIEDSESEIVALKREVEEELGVTIEIEHKAGTWSFVRKFDNQIVSVQNYRAKIIDGEINLSNEHSGLDWIRPNEIGKYPLKDNSLRDLILKEYPENNELKFRMK